MEHDVQSADGSNVGQVDPSTIDVKHFIRARVGRMGRAVSRDGNWGGPANDGHASGIHARRRPTVRRRILLLSRAQLWRYGDHVHEAAELRRPGQFLSLALRSDDGAFTLLVPKELLPLLHVRGVSHLS